MSEQPTLPCGKIEHYQAVQEWQLNPNLNQCPRCEIERLARELALFKNFYGSSDNVVCLSREQREEISRLRAALRDHGMHADDCDRGDPCAVCEALGDSSPVDSPPGTKVNADETAAVPSDSWLESRKRLGTALTEWRDAGAHPEIVAFAIEDLFETIYGKPAVKTDGSKPQVLMDNYRGPVNGSEAFGEKP